MKITLEWLKEKNACPEGVYWFKNYANNSAVKRPDAIIVLKCLMKEDHLDWANWTAVRVMERKQYLAYSIFAAEQVLDIFEKKYPTDDRPRKAIESARECLKNDTETNRNSAYAYAYAYTCTYADFAAASAASAASFAVDSAAAYAASAAAFAAAAADSAVDSAYADAAAADSAVTSAYADADDARNKMNLKILKYGLKLIEGDEI